MTPYRRFDVPEVLEVHVVPSGEVRMVPEEPTDTNVLFPYVTLKRGNDVPEVLSVHVVPSGEVRMVPKKPTVTKVPFP